MHCFVGWPVLSLGSAFGSFTVCLFYGFGECPAGGPAILVANHTGGGDILAIHTAIKPWIHWVAKKESLFKHKLFGTVL